MKEVPARKTAMAPAVLKRGQNAPRKTAATSGGVTVVWNFAWAS